jgi:putative membrane protein
MTEPAAAPRVYSAGERTLLAWLRTGIGIMAFGFVVARFGTFLQLLQVEGQAVPGLITLPGCALVGLRVLATAGGAEQHRRFCRTIPAGDKPSSASPRFVLGVSWAVVAIGLALGIVLTL